MERAGKGGYIYCWGVEPVRAGLGGEKTIDKLVHGRFLSRESSVRIPLDVFRPIFLLMTAAGARLALDSENAPIFLRALQIFERAVSCGF